MEVGRWVGCFGRGEAPHGPSWDCRCDEQEEIPRLKRAGGLHSARPGWWPRRKGPGAAPGGLIPASVTHLARREGVPPWAEPLGFTGLPGVSRSEGMQTVCSWYLGVARSASRPKAALAIGCSLTRGLWTSFGRVT